MWLLSVLGFDFPSYNTQLLNFPKSHYTDFLMKWLISEVSSLQLASLAVETDLSLAKSGNLADSFFLR